MQVQRPALVQQQKLKMSPQLYQSIQLMALPIQDLRLRIQQELEQNPALEVVEEQSTVSLEEVEDTPSEDVDYFENSSDPGHTRSYDTEASDSKRQFMEGALSRPESLQEHLMWQLRLQPISQEEFELGELLIHNLDENGFHREDPETFVPERRLDALRRVCAIIQSFEPVGTCVSDYRESLLVQARLSGTHPEGTETIIEEHLDLLEREKYREIARKMGITEDQVHEALEFIRTLTPFPGRKYSSESPRYVIPDLMITMKDGQFVIYLNDEEIPVLDINPFFDQMNNTKSEQKDVNRFVKSSVKDARWFIHSIQQRNQTLVKVARAIVEFQRDFFLKGPKYLVPLTLKDIATTVDVHEATVSRITTSKYVQTEWGIFELKYFFSNSISGAGSKGSHHSKVAVKERIREILEEEKGNEKHLSDQRIADLLKQRGISIARRTVAKYRKELDISSSYDR
ncbi:MAG: RNA polymerase factor sigma-54 [Spirochaetota bacterium]